MRPALSATALKWIAVVSMIVDHTIELCCHGTPLFTALGMIGKVAAPIMFFLVAEGYRHTKDIGKYMIRLFVAGVISQFPFSMYVNRGVFLPFCANIMFTLLLSLVCLHIYRKEEICSVKCSVIFLLMLLSYFCDWGIFGIAFALSFGIFEDRTKQLLAYLAVNTIKVATIYLLYGSGEELLAYTISPIVVTLLLSIYNEKKGGCRHKWLFYAIYPLQFLTIYGAWHLTGGV